MTLRRQIGLMAGALIFLLLLGNLFVTVNSASKYFQQQLNARAYDAATSLALSMSNAAKAGDEVMLERMMDVLFDRGFFSEISLELMSGKTLNRQARQATHEQAAPSWFMDMIKLQVSDAQTDVTSGWQRIGSLTVKSHTDFAYRDLWSIVRGEIIWFLWMTLISLVSLEIILRWMFKPLIRVERQALDISERNLYELPAIPRSRELKRVVLAMNTMVRKLKAIFAEQTSLTEKLRKESFIDDVTMLLNRRGFDLRLQHLMEHPDGHSGILVLMQLQDFAQYNQDNGREAGDELLRQIGSAIEQWHQQRSDALVSRRTGSDFAFYIPATDLSHADELLRECFSFLSATALSLRAETVFHMGGVFLQSEGLEADVASVELSPIDAFSRADVALRQSQVQRNSHFQLYRESNEDSELTAGEWKLRLEKILADESLQLHFQPVIQVASKDVLHFEVLSRIQEQEGTVAAARFWPMVERHQLAPRFDLMIIRNLLSQLKEEAITNARFCVNVSAASVINEEFHVELKEVLQEFSNYSQCISLEVPEFSIAHIEPHLARLANMVKDFGVALGVDQVGTGTLAFAYLQRLPLDYIRIAGSFNRGLHQAMDHRFFVQSMVQIAHNLDLILLGEGVECEDDVDALKSAGVDGMSGYFFTRPIDSLLGAMEWPLSTEDS